MRLFSLTSSCYTLGTHRVDGLAENFKRQEPLLEIVGTQQIDAYSSSARLSEEALREDTPTGVP